MARTTRLLSALLAVFSVCCLLVALQGKAWGYVDPGSGFVALQTFASVAAAGGYFLRRRIRALFAGKEEPAPAEPVRPVTPLELKDESQGRA